MSDWTPNYWRADAAFNEALRLAGAEAHGPTMVITRFIVDAALDGLSLTEETQHDYVCCAKGLPANHEAEVVTERRWVSQWEQPTGLGTGIPPEGP